MSRNSKNKENLRIMSKRKLWVYFPVPGNND